MTQIVSKPSYGASLIRSKTDGLATDIFQNYLDDLEEVLNTNLLGLQVQLPIYTVATLPAATTAGGMVFVSNETGGPVPAFSDGMDWRRMTDRNVVS